MNPDAEYHLQEIRPKVTGPEQHAATVERLADTARKGIYPDTDVVGIEARAALVELVALAREGAALRAVAAQPHAPADGVGTDGAVHVYEPGHPMGCPICQAIEAGLA